MVLVPFMSLLCFFQDGTSSAPANNAITIESIQSALTATGLSNELSETKLSFKLVFDHPDSRTQSVFVATKDSVVRNIKTVTIYTSVWVSNEAPKRELLLGLLSESKKAGQYYLFKDSNNNWSIRFGVQFDASHLPNMSNANDPLIATLKDAIYLVNQVGEETDRKLNGTSDIK